MAVKRIYIDGEIIPDAWNWFGDENTSLIGVRDQVSAFGSDVYDEIEVCIFSPGGFCSEGWAIHDYLQTLGKKLTGIAYGQCASIATIIFSACSVRKISANCDFMVHLPWGGVEGNEHEVLNYYNELVIEGDKIAGKYFSITGGKDGDKAAIKASLSIDRHMTGQTAVDTGYATELLADQSNALQARTNGRKVKPPVAYLRRPKNVGLKTDNPNPLPVEKPISKPVNEMAKPVVKAKKKNETEVEKAFRGIKNVVSGRPYSALDVNVDGGQVLVIDVQGTDPATGDPCTIDGAQAPAGDYTATDDSTVYSVGSDGTLTAVTPATDDAATDDTTDAATAAVVVKLRKQLQDKTNEVAVLKAEKSGYIKALNESARLLGDTISVDVVTNARNDQQAKAKKPAVAAVTNDDDDDDDSKEGHPMFADLSDEDRKDAGKRMKARIEWRKKQAKAKQKA